MHNRFSRYRIVDAIRPALPIVLLACMAVAGAGPVSAGETPAGTGDASADDGDKPDRATIDRLVKQLGARLYARREEATRRLAEIGPPAIDRLVEALTADDLEVRLRAGEILKRIGPPARRSLAARWRKADPEGKKRLWGVLSAIARQKIDDNPRLIGIDLDVSRRDDGAEIVRVMRARPGSPAARAGLRPGDTLVKVNGMPLKDFQTLKETVQVFDKMALEIRRGEKTIEVNIVVAEDGKPLLQMDDILR